MTEEGRPTGASELMRSLGLEVDGPARWAQPAASRAPGVFVVELPGGLAEAPVDFVAVRRWIERVPAMTIDGERAEPRPVADRLVTFWLPGEPILYVGRSTRTIGGRLAAIYGTPLGDARPSSAANWLKTLAVQDRLRVWWAETDAHEEYEDALLGEVAARNGGRLPFGNVASAAGVRRIDGLAGTLLDAEPLPASRPTARRTRATAVPRAGPAAGSRAGMAARPSSRRAAPAASSTRRTSSASSAALAPQPTYLSQTGLDQLAAELHELRSNVRPEVIGRVKAARELGDLRENADYEYARKEQSFVEGRIQTLEQMLKTSVVIEAPAAGARAYLGSTVVVETDGEEATYLLVGPTEADPAAGRISHVSPVGRALLGARPGDEVNVQLPTRTVSYRVRDVR